MNDIPRRRARRSLLFVALLLVAAPALRAQTAEQFASAKPRLITANTPTTKPLRLKRVAPLKVAETPEGTRVTVASDAPLDDYAARREGDDFVVTLPHAEFAQGPSEIRGGGFERARAEHHGDGLRLSFRLRDGVQARATQSFNRLDIFFTTRRQQTASAVGGNVPADASAPADSTDNATAKESNGDSNKETSKASKEGGLTEAEREAMRAMLRRVEELEARVKELEAERAKAVAANAATSTTSVASTTPSASSVTPAAVDESAAVPAPVNDAAGAGGHESQDAHGQHEEVGQTGPPRLQVQGYADINLRASNEKGRTTSFALGQLDLFITSKLSEKFSVLSELIIEADENNEFSFEIHRLLLRYAHNDHLTLSAGRYHSAIGYWNTAYHHGSWFQTTVNRPFIFSFESKGGILPLHNVGVSATGRVPGAPLGLRYIAEVGNGRASRSPLDRAVQTAVDENNGKAYNVGLFVRPRQVPGLQAGFSVYRDRLTPRDAPNVGQTIGAGYVVYQGPRYEILNEAVFVRHTSRGRTFTTPAFYTLVSRRFGDARPFFRYQYTNVPGDDPVYPNVGRRNGPSVGLRYDVSDYAAFKAQYDHTSRRRLSALDELILQLAFTF